VKGEGVFRRLKYESGVHRVQRVPETESLGRTHTSTMTVAILPIPEEVKGLVGRNISTLIFLRVVGGCEHSGDGPEDRCL